MGKSNNRVSERAGVYGSGVDEDATSENFIGTVGETQKRWEIPEETIGKRTANPLNIYW